MSELTVDIRIDLVVDGNIEELDEAAVAARIAVGDTATLRNVRGLDGRIHIGSEIEISDELDPLVQRLCFNAVTELVRDGAVFEYRYFSQAETAQLRADGDTVVLSGSALPETTFSRRDLLRGLYSCGARWLTTLDGLGLTPQADYLRQYAAAAQSALSTAGLL
jgi:hypothetical protein